MLKKVLQHTKNGTLAKAFISKVNGRVIEPLANRKFIRLKNEANGMLSPAIYKKIYKTIYKLPDLDII